MDFCHRGGGDFLLICIRIMKEISAMYIYRHWMAINGKDSDGYGSIYAKMQRSYRKILIPMFGVVVEGILKDFL